MKQFEKRIRVLEKAAGQVEDNSFCAAVARVHARGESIRTVIIDIGETVEEVFGREGVGPDEPVIVRVIYPGRPILPLDERGSGLRTHAELIESVRKRNARGEATEEKLETAGEASPAVLPRVSRPHKRSFMAK